MVQGNARLKVKRFIRFAWYKVTYIVRKRKKVKSLLKKFVFIWAKRPNIYQFAVPRRTMKVCNYRRTTMKCLYTIGSGTHPQKRPLVPVVCKHNQSVLLRGVAACDWRANRVQLVWTTKFSVWLPSLLRRWFGSCDHAIYQRSSFYRIY